MKEQEITGDRLMSELKELRRRIAAMEKAEERRMQAEEALQDSEERYRMLFHRSPVGILNYSIDLHITDCNNRFVEIVQSSRERLLGFDVTKIRDQSVLPCLRKAAEGEEGVYEGHYRATTGPAEVWVFMRTAPILDKDGRVVSCVAIVEDVTERKEAEARLRESERKYRRIFENVQDVFYQTDLEGNIIEISPSIERYSGLTREELIGRPAVDFYYYPADRAKLLDSIQRKGEVIDFEVRLRTKDGRLVYASVNAHFLVDGAGTPIGLEGSLRDITQRKHLEEQLLHAQKMEAIGQLAGGVAHDFNNILTAIMGYGNLLKLRLTRDDHLNAYLDQILSSTEKAATLTSSLLAFSRRQVIRPKPTDVSEIVRKTEELLTRLIGEDIELRSSIANDYLTVFADEGQIEQVLMNLATNARDAMPEGGILSIDTRITELTSEFKRVHGYGEAGRYALISVSDTGEGMNEETRQRIFEPFFTTKETGKGTGLGLAMAYGIIKQHRGYINCYSEVGSGTTFKIYLPLITPVENAQDRREMPPLMGGFETILIGEDDADVRRLETEILTASGYSVIEAVNGEEALKAFHDHGDRIDLLILDVIMPQMNGREVCEAVRKVRPGVKVLFVSGYPADFIHRKGIMEEGSAFVSKPLSPQELLRKVREVLDQ